MTPISLSAATTIVGVMGDPVAHSLSPLIHNSAFAHLGLDWVCVGFPVPDGSAEPAVRGMAALGIAGMSVTMPHKRAVIRSLDEVEPDAHRLEAVNCIVLRGGRLLGLNTDGEGFVAGLHQDFGVRPRGMRCAVIGAGGAARSVIVALARHGASSIVIVNRTPAAAESAARLVQEARVGDLTDLRSCDLVVNATSVGMDLSAEPADSDGDPIMPCDPGMLRAGQYVVDLIYKPLETAWLRAASSMGVSTANGRSMLINQAAVAFEYWTGEPAPVSVMAQAVQSHLLDPQGSVPASSQVDKN